MAPARGEPLPGLPTQIGPYRLEREIVRGGISVVLGFSEELKERIKAADR